MSVIMRSFQCIILLVFIYYSSGANLTCYICDRCPEPFDASKVGIQSKPDGDGYYCTKTYVGGFVKRDMEKICVEVNAGGQGTWCCRSNYCNSAASLACNPLIWLLIMIIYRLKN